MGLLFVVITVSFCSYRGRGFLFFLGNTYIFYFSLECLCNGFERVGATTICTIAKSSNIPSHGSFGSSLVVIQEYIEES